MGCHVSLQIVLKLALTFHQLHSYILKLHEPNQFGQHLVLESPEIKGARKRE
jgi:hypothetical protein